MAAALNKIAPTSPSRQRPSELESSIASALYDLETNIPDMKTALRPLQFVSAREVRVTKESHNAFLQVSSVYLPWANAPGRRFLRQRPASYSDAEKDSETTINAKVLCFL